MEPLRNGENMQSILVLGAGISGTGAAQVLLKRGCRVVVSDLHGMNDPEAQARLADEGAVLIFGEQKTSLLDNIDTVILSPVIPRENPVVAEALRRRIPVWSEVELAYRAAQAPILAVTGTNGKTTTVSLLGSMLEKEGIPFAEAGNIGRSLSLAAEAVPAYGLIAAELSSFQLEFIDSFRPKAAVILNITPDHMERHHTMEAYVRAKARIFENMGPEESLLLNREDAYTKALAAEANTHVCYLSTEGEVTEGAYLEAGQLFLKHRGERIRLLGEDELQIQGKHNVQDCLAAAFLAFQGGISLEAIRQAAREYHALEHRMEFVRTVHGVSYYNDSKATNTDAAVKALGVFDKPVILIAGGYDKGTPLDQFMQYVRLHVKRLILLGDAAQRFRDAAEQAGISDMTMARSMKDAVAEAAAHAESGDVVLLSPACASYDMYRSYGERGRDFKQIVQALH